MTVYKLRYLCAICSHVLIDIDQLLQSFNLKLDVVCPECHTSVHVDRTVIANKSGNGNLIEQKKPDADKSIDSLDNPDQYI